MSVITIKVPDDLAPNQNKEREYDVAFNPDPAGLGAGRIKFHIFQIWDENGRDVTGEERALVAACALDCYYVKMLAALRGENR